MDVVAAAEELAEKETGDAVRPLFSLARREAERLAVDFEADPLVVTLGVLFMDLKLKECSREGKRGEHVARSAAAAKAFLAEHDIDAETTKRVVNCVEAHHREIPFTCIEAEICANADCYKFLHPFGYLHYVSILTNRGKTFSEILDQVEYKLDEKWGILSLDVCKKELEQYYRQFKKMIAAAREKL